MGILDAPSLSPAAAAKVYLPSSNLSALGVHIPERDGAKGDVVYVGGASMTAGSAVLSGVTFGPTDVGKVIVVAGAGSPVSTATLSAAATSGTTSVQVSANLAPGMYWFGSQQARVESVTGSSAPYTATLRAGLGGAVASGSTVYWPNRLVTTIQSVSTGQATLAASAAVTVSSVQIIYGTDDTAAVQAAMNRATEGQSVYFSKKYLITGKVTVSARGVSIGGAGGAYTVDSSTMPQIQSGLIATSTDGLAVANGAGSTHSNYGVVYIGAGVPASGTGVYVTNGWHMKVDNITVAGFFNNVFFMNCWYFSFHGNSIYDWSGTGLTMTTNDINYNDHGDMSCSGNTFSLINYTGLSDATVRWMGGGGLRFVDNKINSYVQPGSYFTGRVNYGLELKVRDGCSTSVFIIVGNSIENAALAQIKIDGVGTGYFEQMRIVGNEIFGGIAGIDIGQATTSSNNIRQIAIAENNFHALTYGIRVSNVNGLSIGTNQWRGVGQVITLSRVLYDVQIERQHTDGNTTGTVIQDNRTWSNNPNHRGTMIYDYISTLAIATVGTWNNTHKVNFAYDGTYGSSGVLDVTCQGYHTSVGAFFIQAKRVVTVDPTGVVTIATVGTDVTAGPGQVAVQFVTGAAGLVRVQVQLPSSATNVNAYVKTRLRAEGMLSTYYIGTA